MARVQVYFVALWWLAVLLLQVVGANDDDPGSTSASSGSSDALDDGIYDAFSADPSCTSSNNNNSNDKDGDECWSPPASTVETETVLVQQEECQNVDQGEQQQCRITMTHKIVDKHWGSDERILEMRDKLLNSSSPQEQHSNNNLNHDYGSRPPVFLMPGLASTRLVSWKFKRCAHKFMSDVKVQDYVWLNIPMLVQMGTISPDCWKECMTLGLNQTDGDDCKLRPDEGLDAISSLAPGSLGSNWVVGGGTNTVYAWLIQWLADNLGYDVGSLVGLPYDWRLSPNVMETRDGFLTFCKLRIEAAVQTNGRPGIMVAHSMGNAVFRYFLEWLRQGMREEAYEQIVLRAERRAKAQQRQRQQQQNIPNAEGGWMGGVVSGLDELWNSYFAQEQEQQQNKQESPSTTTTTGESSSNDNNKDDDHKPFLQFWELAKMEGDNQYMEWLEKHIWSYVGLSAPLLGAPNPVRAAISGENMGLPISDEVARHLEKSFGSTHSCNPISSKMGFCDRWDDEDWQVDKKRELLENRASLACLDDIVKDMESGFAKGEDCPWKDFPQLEVLLKQRVDWDSDVSFFSIVQEECLPSEKSPCRHRTVLNLGPRDAQSGELFTHFSDVWKEEGDPMKVKREQLEQAFWHTNVPNTLNATWDRPHIKHVIMAYGVDVPTEVGYVYKKTRVVNDDDNDSPDEKTQSSDGLPSVDKVIWEEPNGMLVEESIGGNAARGKLTESLIKKKTKKQALKKGMLAHSGDGTIPYLSLSWAHTWLLHAARARMYSQQMGGDGGDKNPLNAIKVSHRPDGGSEWKSGTPPTKPGDDYDDSAKTNDNIDDDDDDDTGTNHPHGTKYKPTMVRYRSDGKSRTTGMEYSTTVIEAIGVEHKETTRNYDILAAVFTDVLKHMHQDFGF